MYIYISLEKAKDCIKQEDGRFRFLGEILFEKEITPHIVNHGPVELLLQNPVLKECFVKATDQTFHNFSSSRELGIYYYGKAEAELSNAHPDSKSPYVLRIKTLTFEGMADMGILRKKIEAGTIIPTISYEKKQHGQNPFDVLRQILDSRKFNWFQRIILALRLMRKTKAAY